MRTLLQHSDTATTIRYLGVSDDKIEKVLQKVVLITHAQWSKAEEDVEDDYKHVESNRLDVIRLKCEVTKNTVEKLDEYCHFSDNSVNFVVEQAIKEFLNSHNSDNIR